MFRFCKYYFWLIYCTLSRIINRDRCKKKRCKYKPVLKKKTIYIVTQLSITKSFLYKMHGQSQLKKYLCHWSSLDHMLSIKHTDKQLLSVCVPALDNKVEGYIMSRMTEAKVQFQCTAIESYQYCLMFPHFTFGHKNQQLHVKLIKTLNAYISMVPRNTVLIRKKPILSWFFRTSLKLYKRKEKIKHQWKIGRRDRSRKIQRLTVDDVFLNRSHR